MTAPNPLYQEGYSMTDTTDQQAVTVAQDKLPTRCDGKEQYAFEAWAAAQRYDMNEHPLHYLFLNERTAAARDGWAAGLKYASDIAARLASVSSANAEEEALAGYRAAVSWISADSWDGCSDCIEILKAARAADSNNTQSADPDATARELSRIRLHRPALAASPEPVPATNQAGEVRTEWRCFHCGDAFTDERCARLHFGRDEDSAPACQIKAGAEQGLLGALRDAEYAAADAMRAIADECTDAAKAYYSQMTRHNQALRNAEELGYERGLADARALATQPATSQEGEVASVGIFATDNSSYMRLTGVGKDDARLFDVRVSRGAAETLANEIGGLLHQPLVDGMQREFMNPTVKQDRRAERGQHWEEGKDVARLARQTTTSQEGEAIAMARRCQQARHSAVEPVERDNVLREAATLLRRLAATPTPPTLSEDLREALEPFDKVAKHMGEKQNIHVIGWNGDNVTYADFRRLAALAQVKAS